jgi:hypothetical protein
VEETSKQEVCSFDLDLQSAKKNKKQLGLNKA